MHKIVFPLCMAIATNSVLYCTGANDQQKEDEKINKSLAIIVYNNSYSSWHTTSHHKSDKKTRGKKTTTPNLYHQWPGTSGMVYPTKQPAIKNSTDNGDFCNDCP